MLSTEGLGRPQQGHPRHKFTAVEEMDCPIGDIMSVPLDRLCQLAWPLLRYREGENLGKAAEALPLSQTDAEDVYLARIIGATASETISFFWMQPWWGQLTCHTLRLALFRKALHSILVTSAVVPSGQSAESVSPTVSPLAPQNVTTGEREPHGGVEAKGAKAPRGSVDCSVPSEEVAPGKARIYAEKRRAAPMEWVLPYFGGQEDEQWLTERVREMVEMAFVAHNDCQKQLVSTAAYVSVHAQSHKRGAQVFLFILREVLDRWNAAPDTTGEAGIFGFGVVVPLLDIVRFTKFNNTDTLTVGKLLATVRLPSRGRGLSNECLSNATFVTRYVLSLGERVADKEEEEEEEDDEEETSGCSSHSHLPQPSQWPNWGSLMGDQMAQERSHRADHGSNAVAATMVTDTFLMAPLARKVSVHVRRASSCEGVQLLLVPRASIAASATAGTPAAGEAEAETGENDGGLMIKTLWFAPREGETYELLGGCDAVVRYKRNPEGATQPRLQVEIRVETSLEVDGRWVVELRNTLSGTQLIVAEAVLQGMKSVIVTGDGRMREESLALFRNGLLSQPRGGALPTFVQDILSLDEDTLRRRVPCRQSDARGVRAALSLIGMFLSNHEAEVVSWESRLWQDAVKRVGLASSSLGKNPGATEMATFVLEHVALCQLSMPQIVEGTIALLTSNISVSEIRHILSTNRTRAELCVLALSLLLRAKENFVPRGMFHLVSLLRDFMACEGSHYLRRFRGCGESLEEEIRGLVHLLLTNVFTALHRVMSLPEAERERHGPHRFLWDSDDFAPFALVTLSLLASPLDARDIDFVWCKIAGQLEWLLPNFTDFARTASFKVSEMEEGSMLEALQALASDSTADHGGSIAGGYADRGSGVGQPSIGMTMTGASERGLGVWVPTGRERVCSSSTPLYTPGLPVPAPCIFSSPSSSLSSSASAPLAGGPPVSPSTICAAEVQLVSAPSRELIVALATKQLSGLTANSMKDDPAGFYFLPNDGKLHHNGSQLSLPPLFQGDTLAFSFSFAPRTSTRALCVLVNGVRIAEFPAPRQQLFLLAGVMDSSALRSCSLRVCFRSQKEMYQAAPAVACGNHDAVLNALPTRHSISVFATNVFFYLISLCARRVAQFRRQGGAAGASMQAMSPTASANRVHALHTEEVWRGFVDSCCNSLRQNVESLIDSITRLPPVSQVNDATERVKRNAASFVYHRFLMDYITMIRTVVRCLSSPVDVLSTLSRVVCCEDVGERERCAALTIACSLLCEPHRAFAPGAYNPQPLWDCCRSLSRHVTALTYQPLFTVKSAAAELTVCSGGRRIKFVSAPSGASRARGNATSFASRGIPLDGSLGEVVAFSVRLQRSFAFDTLGRFYNVGLACPYPMSATTTLTSHPGEWQSIAHTYAITDYFTDIASPSARSELPRHAKHWMSNEENIIFGSGDVITVIVHTKLRCISFERNGFSLGTLYTNIPAVVKVLFPFVELFNRDALALWLYPPREIGIRARFTMRAMLYHWGTELLPRLNQMLKDDDVVALQVLGADGDERCFWYRSPPRSELKGSRVVHLVRQIGSRAEVLVEGSTKSMKVLAMALEPNYTAAISNELPVTPVVEELLRIVFNSISFTTKAKGCDMVRIQPTKMFLCALRLLSEMELTPLLAYDVEVLRILLAQLIRILELPDAIPAEGQYILLEAWNELLLLPDDDALWLPLPLPRDTNAQDALLLDSGGSTGPDDAGGDKASDMCLRCPTCDAPWGDCASDGHVAPYSLCFTLHCVLQRLGVPSPFTGFICEWSLPGTHFCVTIRVGPRGELEGEGEETRGLFTFTAKLVSGHFLRGSCVYKGANNPTARAQLEEEWACELCTFINLADSTRCAMCTTARPDATWTCVLCGYAFNSKNNAICTTCGHQRMGASETDSRAEKKLAFCEGCGGDREYTKFDDFDCHAFCQECQRESRWLPEEKYTGLIEATLVGAGDTMDWKIILGDTVTVCAGLRTDAYSLEGMQQAAAAASPAASELSRYVPPLVQIRTAGADTLSPASPQQPQQQKKLAESSSALVPAILFFCSRIVCRWGPELAPHQLSNSEVLHRLRVLDDAWLAGLEKVPFEAARGICSSSLRILLAGTRSGQVIRSLSSVARVLVNSHAALQKQRHYLLYALCVNAMRCAGDREVREVCYAALNTLLEESAGQRLNVSSLRDVVAITPIVAEQQRLMVHASLRGVDVCTRTNVISTSWLIKAVERMERCERLPAIFDEPSPDIFPYLVELPDTRMGDGGELIVGQVRGSVGVLASKGGRYYYELVVPANLGTDRGKTVVMGWGTMQHEVLSGGQHVGSDIHSWGFNCQDQLRVLTGEQAIPTPRPIVGSDVIGALLDLDAMMMCWSVNGEQLMWVTVSTQGKGEAIYPFVSASVDPVGVVVRLGHTQFKPDGYEDFSPFSNEMARRESHVEPRSYDFYVQLCNLGNEIVNCGFTLDSLLATSAWFDQAQAAIAQYPLLAAEVADKALEWLRPYLQHLRSINFLAISVAKSHDILRNSPYLMLSYQKTRQLLFFSARWAIVERQIDRRLIRSNPRQQREVVIDLNRAKAMAQSSESLDFMTRFEGSITGQLFRQTKEADIYLDAVMFVISLAGEVADDAGGVTRSVVTMMCDELNYREEDDGRRVDPLLPFFRLTGHTTMASVVPNMDFYRENPEHRLLFVDVFTWLGKLIGNATMSGYLMFSLTFPRLTWKFLTFDKPTIEDYHADIDDTVRGALNDDEFLLNDDFFYSIPGIAWCDEGVADTMGMVRSARVCPALTPARSAVDLTTIAPADENEEDATAAQRRREAVRALLHQYDELLLAMLSGITFVIPAPSLQLIRWDDLQQRVCGNACATAEDVISSLNLSLLSEDLRRMLKEVVCGWTPQRRSQFLLFCSGQRRIPLPEKVQVACGDDPNAVPTAHTCSPISLLLHPYPSATVLREKLEVSLRHAYEFGFA
ncbi:uncharacterized protein Tco025E_00608 [Trypanosoma conorhini]|uniref:RanBP2-type domain-containing protein n=1 Tax=Trypanosoma conorhini TaxID=83891 RepID=A0A3R7P145_9TRYP|nr:uncharacterized protein Tco025E_00608 [Trypanosoma conorhini]RNF27171.1 hypothetical protein Tco025E_00608 [Trypanosoma conorhini]